MRSRYEACARLAVLFAILSAAVSAAPAAGPPLNAAADRQQADAPLRGRLATVEPAARRLTLVVDGEETLTEVLVHPDGDVRQDDEKITLRELVGCVGSRVTVRYAIENGLRVARTVIVDGPAPPPPAATAPTRRA